MRSNLWLPLIKDNMQSTLELSELTFKIAQLFMTGMAGPELDDGTRRLVEIGVGGIILFSRNIKDPEQVACLSNKLQNMALKRHGTPLFVAIDQEGGRVARLKEPFTLFPGNEAMATSPDPEKEARGFAKITSKELSLVGINMNLAPVLDIPRGKPEAHLVGRSFGSDPVKVSILGSLIIRELQKGGIIAVAKHFPGLGAARQDPHKSELVIDVEKEDLKEIDLKPYQAAIRIGVSGIMVSHAIYPKIDPRLPASLSSAVMEGILRQEFGFQGLILTDDLEMGAITSQWEVPVASSMAFGAGADLLLICKDQKVVLAGIEEIRRQVLQGEIPLGRLQDSTRRIKKLKSRISPKTLQPSLDKVRKYWRHCG